MPQYQNSILPGLYPDPSICRVGRGSDGAGQSLIDVTTGKLLGEPTNISPSNKENQP